MNKSDEGEDVPPPKEHEVLVLLRITSSSDPYDVANRVGHAVHSQVPDRLDSMTWWIPEGEETEGES